VCRSALARQALASSSSGTWSVLLLSALNLMEFEIFDPHCEVRITQGNLPHWFQPGVTYFITFRTEDSMPRNVADLWYHSRNEWLARHHINPTYPNWQQELDKLPINQRREFHSTFSREYLAYLDQGHGACVLKRADLSGIVAKSLLHFEGERYRMGDFVVMPNHVHLLVCLLESTDLQEQCYSWKKFTATQINQLLSRRGRFWQEESFDHLVRSPEEFEHLQRYIAENPTKASLRQGEYFHYRRSQ
jgi:putative transposase